MSGKGFIISLFPFNGAWIPIKWVIKHNLNQDTNKGGQLINSVGFPEQSGIVTQHLING